MHIELTRDELRTVLVALNNERINCSHDLEQLHDNEQFVAYVKQLLTNVEGAYDKLHSIYLRVPSKQLLVHIEE